MIHIESSSFAAAGSVSRISNGVEQSRILVTSSAKSINTKPALLCPNLAKGVLTLANTANREHQRVQVEHDEPWHHLKVHQLDVAFVVVRHCYTQPALHLCTTSKSPSNILICKQLARLVYS